MESTAGEVLSKSTGYGLEVSSSPIHVVLHFIPLPSSGSRLMNTEGPERTYSEPAENGCVASCLQSELQREIIDTAVRRQ